MRVQHNIVAMNSYRNYNNNTRGINKNLEKLSSGYKINRAGDDAAGLAISEKMRAQITGLEGAQKNAKDGISLVQTAEGALTEVHSMLNRMYSLAEQSANGTYNDEVDREQLQKEIEKLSTEIDRIADSSNFNGQKLLDGSLSSTGGSVASVVKMGENTVSTKINAVKGDYVASLAGDDGNGGSAFASTILSDLAQYEKGDTIRLTFTYRDNASGTDKNAVINAVYEGQDENNQHVYSVNGTKYTGAGDTAQVDAILNGEVPKTKLGSLFTTSGSWDTTNNTYPTFTANNAGSAGAVVDNLSVSVIKSNGIADNVTYAPESYAFTSTTPASDAGYSLEGPGTGVTAYDPTNPATNGADNAVFTINGKKFAFVDDPANTDLSGLDKSVTVLDGGNGGAWTYGHAEIIAQKTGLDVQFDGTSALQFRGKMGTSASGGLQLQIGDTGDSFNQMKVEIKDIHSNAIGIGGLDISTVDDATAAMEAIKDAINYVSDVRGGLGATQNRLEHTINNLSVMQENIQDAESTIRDTDVADEMMKYTKNSILVQSAQAMLAQANQQPQGVLQLLQ